jgi:hypothetical protein
MVFVEDFEVFIQEAEELYRSNPLATRYCIKYRHCDGKLVLKVTDDVKVQFQRPMGSVTSVIGLRMATWIVGYPSSIHSPLSAVPSVQD